MTQHQHLSEHHTMVKTSITLKQVFLNLQSTLSTSSYNHSWPKLVAHAGRDFAFAPLSNPQELFVPFKISLTRPNLSQLPTKLHATEHDILPSDQIDTLLFFNTYM